MDSKRRKATNPKRGRLKRHGDEGKDPSAGLKSPPQDHKDENRDGEEEGVDPEPVAAASATPEAKVIRKRTSKQKGARKPKDMPRRPMSAYNAFFQEQRAMLIEQVKLRTAGEATGSDSSIGFESMAKTIAQRWKKLRPEDLGPYKKRSGGGIERAWAGEDSAGIRR